MRTRSEWSGTGTRSERDGDQEREGRRPGVRGKVTRSERDGKAQPYVIVFASLLAK